MSERLALAIGALAAKTAYRLLKKQKKKTPPPPPEKGGEERRQPQEKDDIEILQEEIRKQTGKPMKEVPWYSGLPHGTYTREGYRKRWVFRTTDLGTPQQWARFLAPYIDVLYSPRQDGGIYHLPIIFATTGIILTRDGRLLALPQGETSFEIATKIWKPFLDYLKMKALEKARQENIPLPEAAARLLKEWGLTEPPESEYSEYHPISNAENAILGVSKLGSYDFPWRNEAKKRFLRLLKKIYLDELGLDWMPLPLVMRDYHEKPHGEMGTHELNQIVLQELPGLLRELGLDPEHPLIKKRVEAVKALITGPKFPEYWQIRLAAATIEALHREGKINDEEYEKFLDDLANHRYTEIYKTIEKYRRILEEEPGIPEHTGARELLRMAIAEQLPGWVIKTALDQAKIPLYTSQEGIHPSIVRYHVQRADPTDPRGTLLHGLITTVLSEWEREITAGKTPSHPHETIKHLAATDPTREPTEEEARRIAQSLGLPQSIAPKTLQRVLAELLRDLQELRDGKDPHLLDAEKEAALRYHQLRPLADNREPHPYIRRIILEGKQNILNVYQEIKNQVLAETQLGREEQERTLNTLEKILRENLDQVITTGEPLTQTVAEITKRAEETLRREGIEDPQLRSWATNLLRNILLDAPIIAAARHPSVQYLPLDEKKRIAAALLQYYEREAEKHSIAPVAADLHWMWEKIRKAGEGAEDPKRAMLEAVERIRGAVNAMGNVTRLAYNMYRPLLNAENFAVEPAPGREGMLSHRVAMDLFNIKRRLIEGTFPRIKRTRERP